MPLGLYLIIGTMLMTSRDPRFFVSLLAIAPISIIMVSAGDLDFITDQSKFC
jgi:hypothetical protein